MGRGRGLTAAAMASGVLIALGLGLSLSYWPGVMTWDSIRQYGQALSGRFDDWHPPLMNWIWRQLRPLGPGPAPMLALQLGLWGSGFGLLAGWALKGRRPRLAMALAASSLMPIAVALMAAIIKDSLMAALLLAATGLMAWRRGPMRIVTGALVIVACALRFNAFLAGAPLLVALLPERLRATPGRLAASGLAAAAVLLAGTPLANRLLGAERSGVELSLVIFDLGGITERSGTSAFPPLAGVKDPVAVNRRCYDPVRWDPYADWREELCPVGFAALRPAFKAQGINPEWFWLKTIARHPLAYAQHRLAHFNINARFLVRGGVERPVHDRSETPDEPQLAYQVTPNPALKAVDALALLTAVTPLGWPIFWMAVAAGVLTLARRLPSRRLVAPLALSSLLYGLGYAAVGVSSELRYHLWTMMAALLAACVAAADLSAPGHGPTRREGLIAGLPAAAVVALGAAWRLWPG